MVLAAAVLHPGNVLAWLLVGLIAGALAGRITRGKGYGCIGDVVIGLLGAFVGGLIISPFVHPTHFYGFWVTILVAVIGAVVLLLAIRLIRRIL